MKFIARSPPSSTSVRALSSVLHDSSSSYLLEYLSTSVSLMIRGSLWLSLLLVSYNLSFFISFSFYMDGNMECEIIFSSRLLFFFFLYFFFFFVINKIVEIKFFER